MPTVDEYAEKLRQYASDNGNKYAAGFGMMEAWVKYPGLGTDSEVLEELRKISKAMDLV